VSERRETNRPLQQISAILTNSIVTHSKSIGRRFIPIVGPPSSCFVFPTSPAAGSNPGDEMREEAGAGRVGSPVESRIRSGEKALKEGIKRCKMACLKASRPERAGCGEHENRKNN
jgi:hypothetical protein